MNRRRILAGLILLCLVAAACSLPPGFAEQTTQQALVLPTALAFAPDGRVFVAEKRGTIQTFDSVDDTTPAQFADLRRQVWSQNDHGLLSIDVDPQWPARPYVYVSYTYDAPVGGTAPTYGGTSDADPCPSSGCPTQGRVARLTVGADNRITEQKVLIKDVCFDSINHGGGGLRMAADGSLFVAFGEGSAYDVNFYDPANPCGDPPNERGSLRSQDLRTPGDPTGLSGSMVRINPDTGDPWFTNPLIDSPDPVARKVVAYGLRNPFRLTVKPGTSEVWVADVGSYYAEEINRVDPAGSVKNYGWPCMEGNNRMPEMDRQDKPLCESLYAQGGHIRPVYNYCHTAPSTPGGRCRYGGAAISALEFYRGGSYPKKYDGALFFADYTRNEIRVMLATNGVPDPNRVEGFGQNIGGAVDLRVGPGGDLFYVDIFAGRIQRLFQGSPPPPDTVTPTAIIDAPAAGASYAPGSTIAFAGRALDASGAPLPASALRWDLIVRHCPTEQTCHRHFAESKEGVASGSFTALDHEQPSTLEIGLTATSNGRTDTATVVLDRAGGARAVPGSVPDQAWPTNGADGFLVTPR